MRSSVERNPKRPSGRARPGVRHLDRRGHVSRKGIRLRDGRRAHSSSQSRHPECRKPLLLRDPGRRSPSGYGRRILDGPEGDRDWGIAATVDFVASDDAGKAEVPISSLDLL